MSHVHWIGYPSGLQAAMCDGMWYLSLTWMNYLIRGIRSTSIIVGVQLNTDHDHRSFRFHHHHNPPFSTFTPSPGHRYLLGWASGVGRSKKIINLKLSPLKYVVHKNRRYPPRPGPQIKNATTFPHMESLRLLPNIEVPFHNPRLGRDRKQRWGVAIRLTFISSLFSFTNNKARARLSA